MSTFNFSKASGSSLTEAQTEMELPAGSSILVTGLSGAETSNLKVKVGSSYVNALDSASTPIAFTATATSVNILAAGIYAVPVGATATAVTVTYNVNKV